MRASFVLFLSLLAAGCDKAPEDNRSSGVESFTRVEQHKMPNTGQWLFDGRLKGLSSAEHYVIDALFLQPAGKITLHSHFNGFPWRDGVQVVFKRADELVTMEVVVPGYAPRVAELPLGTMTNQGRLKVRVEVHNADAAGVHVLVWRYNLAVQGQAVNPQPFISEGNADFDSREEVLVFTEHGRGVRWGVEFEQVRVDSAFREAPYVE